MRIFNKLICLLLSILCLVGCNDSKEELTFNESKLTFSISSDKYLLYDINNDSYILNHKIDEPFYPASLTKLVTLDTLLHYETDLDNNYSSFTSEQYLEIVAQNLSTAKLLNGKKYSLRELAYGLILASGADAAYAIENYFSDNGLNLVDEMNKLCQELGMNNSHFTNPTGDHDEDLYTTLSDYLLVVKDLLNDEQGKEIISAMDYKYDNGAVIVSGLSNIKDNGDVEVIAGKTGYTEEAGRNICVYFRHSDNNFYILILANSYGGKEAYFEDCLKIFKMLYN